MKCEVMNGEESWLLTGGGEPVPLSYGGGGTIELEIPTEHGPVLLHLTPGESNLALTAADVAEIDKRLRHLEDERKANHERR